MIKRLCDRCGIEVEHESVFFELRLDKYFHYDTKEVISIVSGNNRADKDYDEYNRTIVECMGYREMELCSDCVKALEKFLGGTKK